MEKVKVMMVSAYSWNCPKCGACNCTEEYCDLICSECDNEFEVGNVE